MAAVRDFEGRGLAAVAISSNSAQSHPQDGPDRMAQDAERYGAILELSQSPVCAAEQQ